MAQPSAPAGIPPPRVAPAGMSRFAARMSNTSVPDRDLNIGAFEPTRTLEFLKVTQRSEATQVTLTGFMLCNDASLSDAQACAYYLSALTTVFPGLESMAKKSIAQMGYNTRDVTVATAAEYMITILGWIELPRLAVMFGQAVLLLFKNITDVGYSNFMTARCSGLKSRAGFEGQIAQSGDIVFPIARARIVRSRLGAIQELRAEVLNALMINRDVPGPIGRVCNYLCEILSWTEMAFLLFIFETLCLTRSPVLLDHRVLNEVRNLHEAFVKINATAHPQYYKILHPASATSVLLKSRFPILIAVSSACRAEHTVTVARYVSTLPSSNQLVIELSEMHKNFIDEHRLANQNQHFRN